MKQLLTSALLILFTSYTFPQSPDIWITHFEKSRFLSTPCYTESIEYFQKLAEYSPFAELKTFGISPQGRELKYLIVSGDGAFNPDNGKETKKPIVLIINGIHSGEIEGKDASMLLLREILISKEKEYLLDSLSLIVVPIFNVDGHERKSKYNRINQNGPEEMGWRTTAQNLNLNRDWLKAEAPEMQAMISLFNEWLPDFIIDSHTTDGADYQYTITYSVEKFQNIYGETANWLRKKFVPYLESKVEQKGILIHPYIYLRNWRKGFDGGIIDWAATPRFSTGYFALQNRPSLLIETHMIKSYKDRVYSTKAAFESVLGLINSNANELVELNERADKNSVKGLTEDGKYLPLAYNNSEKYQETKLKGYKYYWEPSDISGDQKLIYTDEEKDFNVKYYNDIFVIDSIAVPTGYIIPAEWRRLVFSKMELHGVHTKQIQKDTTITVTKYKFRNVSFNKASYEGRQTVSFETDKITEEVQIKAGDIFVPTNQRTVRVIVNAGDSFLRWGYMNSIFEQKEYYENYVMEKLAEEMLNEEPDLRKEFQLKLEEDEEFKNDPGKRLDFFYERSPYYDKSYLTYPVLRIE